MTNHQTSSITILTLFLISVLLYPSSVSSSCTCEPEPDQQNKQESTKYKLISVASLLVSGALGVCLPLLGKKIPALRPENDMFFMIKAFAAGVILATGFVHILTDAFNSLTSPCLEGRIWRNFPFTGFFAMLSAVMTLTIDSFATGYYKRRHFNSKRKQVGVVVDEEVGGGDEHVGHVHVHTHATHGHAHGSAQELGQSEIIRRRIVSQVLEVGIVVHSVIIGVALGASQNPDTIKPLLVALSFHQFFEGMGLGGCISQAQFESRSTAVMAIFFSLTTPIGIAIGIGVSNIYNANSSTSLIIEGVFNSASAGILIYMALVDLLAADFMNPRLQSNLRLQLGANLSLLLGIGCMSVLAKWA